MNVKKELQRLLAKQQEEEYFHIPMEEEFSFYRDIASGNLDILKGNITNENWEHMGLLSANPLQNMKYHHVILIAMITRFCIEGGLEPEQSFTLSDLLIRKVDQCTSHRELSAVKIEAVTAFTNAMNELRRGKELSYHVQHGVDYITKNMSHPLSAGEVAGSLGLHPEYLSKLFKKETGYTLQQYILHKKCEASCYMLKNSTISCTDISSFLGFASCSHYIRCFHREYGITPGQYRRNEDLSGYS